MNSIGFILFFPPLFIGWIAYLNSMFQVKRNPKVWSGYPEKFLAIQAGQFIFWNATFIIIGALWKP